MYPKPLLVLLRSFSCCGRLVLHDRLIYKMETSLNSVLSEMQQAARRYAQENKSMDVREPRLVAVSKTKPVEMIEDAYACGQKCFGENYVQELVTKAKTLKEKGGYDDIKWHFIGHLQRNKVNNLCSAPNLEMVETVDSIKLVDALDRSWANSENNKKLKVMVQVNTSGEKNKNGCSNVEDCLELIKHINNNCPHLEFVGLMTIGEIRSNKDDQPNPDFVSLVAYRSEICSKLGLSLTDVELSMGMSADFVQAIHAGSTNVRVGSTIFGKRDTAK